MASLATALTATGAEFSNELTYVPGMAQRSANRAAFEQGGMQVTRGLAILGRDLLQLCNASLHKPDFRQET